MTNIKNNRYRNFDLRISKQFYYDFTLLKPSNLDFCSNGGDDSYINDCLLIKITPDINFNGKSINSNVVWDDATITDQPILNFGLTGIDSGFIEVSRNDSCVQNDNDNPIYDALVNSELNLPPSMQFHKITSDRNDIDYTIEFDHNTYSYELKGGFFNGFWKLHGYDYQVLPDRYDDGFTISMTINKPYNYPQIEGTLNELNPNNEGFIFFMGVRSCNKFWNTFDGLHGDVCFGDGEYFTEQKESTYKPKEDGNLLIDPDNRLITNNFLIYGQSKVSNDGLGKYVVRDYDEIKDGVVVPNMDDPRNYPTNPFLLFGRNGKNCGEEIESPLYTTCNIDRFLSEQEDSEDSLDFLNDIVDNAFGFRITDDNKFQYRYITKNNDCEFTIREGITPLSIIPTDVFFNLTIKWLPYTIITNKCLNKSRMGDLLVYVDGYLKHVFPNFPEFLFRPLKEDPRKQIGVPYNMSIGGGSIGLKEQVTFDGPDPSDINLIIEEYFSGTFMGNIRSFEFYGCGLSWIDIKKLS